jgi:ABC-type dipeptide/oligopeptide/nickel transport system permease subunit
LSQVVDAVFDPDLIELETRRRWRGIPKIDAALARVSGAVLLIYLLLAIIGPWIVPHDPNALNVGPPFASPSGDFWFGTDELGRDLLSRVIVAARVAVVVGLASVGLALVCGGIFGVLAGYFRGAIDAVTMRGMDVVFAFPELILAIIVIAALGPSLATAIISIGVVYLPRFARVARVATVATTSTAYVDAAKLASLSTPRIILRHILPNIRTPLIVMTALSMSSAQLAYAALSFLGFGARPPRADFGSMLSTGRNFVTFDIWIALFPGLAMVGLIIAFNVFGDAIRDALDPRATRRAP